MAVKYSMFNSGMPPQQPSIIFTWIGLCGLPSTWQKKPLSFIFSVE